MPQFCSANGSLKFGSRLHLYLSTLIYTYYMKARMDEGLRWKFTRDSNINIVPGRVVITSDPHPHVWHMWEISFNMDLNATRILTKITNTHTPEFTLWRVYVGICIRHYSYVNADDVFVNVCVCLYVYLISSPVWRMWFIKNYTPWKDVNTWQEE